MELYTIREAATLLNVTVQSVYNKVAKAEETNAERYIVTGPDKAKRVTADFMKDFYDFTGVIEEQRQANENTVISRLEEELRREREWHEADRQRYEAEIERLHNEIDKLMIMNVNSQTLLLREKALPDFAASASGGTADPAPQADEQAEPVKKKSFLSGILRRD